MGTTGLRNLAILSFFLAMGVLLVGGWYAKDRVPPIPERVVSPDGEVLFTKADILAGQDVFQRYGLMNHGSLWGHGTLRGPDFAAETLHRMGRLMRDHHADPADPQPGAFEKLGPDRRREIAARVIGEIKANRYDEASSTLALTGAQVWAAGRLESYWGTLLGEGDTDYGFLKNTVTEARQRSDLAKFFLWTAWAAGTNRPGLNYTYTSNWPADPTVGNGPPPTAALWSVVSLISLLVVLGLVVYVVHRYEFFYGESKAVDAAYALLKMPLTPSQRATGKFFLVAGLLFLAQILNGGLLANYTVRPATFYVQWIGEHYPYSLAKTWHLQLAILWIAISWVGTSIFVAPAIAGGEPKGQRFLVNLLFWAVVAVAVGSLLGEVLGIKGLLGKAWFWLGHQGWEYLELGRLWQVLLFGGLIYWLVIVYRVLMRALARPPRGEGEPDDDADSPDHRRSLILFYVAAAVLIVMFFGFGLFYGRGTHITIADYWRWFVVHIWVESIFEFFGVAVVALFLVTLGLVSAKSALRVAYLTAMITFLSGIAGVAHHYFWFGGPEFWLAIGGVFSSLEPIPLILLVVRAWMEYRSIRAEGRQFPYRWPLYFLVASSFWNFLGAGVFGFMINLPIINYYEHATYLTSNHGHTALFGVYGMLAVSLILFSWRGLVQHKHWHDGLLKLSFWGLNGGLFLMFASALLPIGLMQLWHVNVEGVWYARSAAFYNLPAVKWIAEWRMVPDLIIILLGAVPLLIFLLTTFPRLRQVGQPGEAAPPARE